MIENSVFLKKSILENKDITSEGILAYVGLVVMSNNKLDKIFTNISMIEFALKITNKDKDRTFKDKIKRGLINLEKNNIIQVISEEEDYKANDGLVIKLLDLYINTKEERFVIMDMKEIVTILRIKDGKTDTDKLLRYTANVIGSINNIDYIGFTTIEDLAEMSNVSEWIIKTKYNKLLEDNKIIYIYRSDKSIRLGDGSIKKINNTYGRYSDKDLVIKKARGYEIELKGKNISGDDARAIKQKYNHFIKKLNDGYIPTDEELQEMNYKVILYNEKYKNGKEIKELKLITLH